MANTGLVLRGPQIEEVQTDFFREAYAAVCVEDPSRQERDREVLQGCVVQISQEFQLNLSIRDGQAAALALLKAFLSLGLAEAAEDSSLKAVALLKAHPTNEFVELGMSLHDELHARATRARTRSVLKLTVGLYGLLEETDEAELEHLSRKTSVFAERQAYADATERVMRAERVLTLAEHLPMRHIIEGGFYFVSYQVEGYRRKDAGTPSPLGGLFFLCLRSALLHAMTTEFAYPSLSNDMTVMKFLRDNLVGNAVRVRQLIIEIFFDPKAVMGLVPDAAAKVMGLFERQIEVFVDHIGRGTTAPVKMKGWKQLLLELIARVLTEFGQEVRKQFATKEEATISPEEMQRFWYPRVLLRIPEHVDATPDDGEGGRLGMVRDEDMISEATEVSTILRLPPDKIFSYIARLGGWPEDKKQAVMDGYAWNDVLDNVSDEELVRHLAKLIPVLGPTFLNKLVHKRLTLGYWMRAWSEEPTLREAILDFFKQERYTRHITATGLMRAVSQGVGGDGRLFIHLLGFVMRDTEGEYLNRVGDEILGNALRGLLLHSESAQALAKRIKPSQRARCIRFYDDDSLDRLRKAVGWPTT